MGRCGIGARAGVRDIRRGRRRGAAAVDPRTLRELVLVLCCVKFVLFTMSSTKWVACALLLVCVAVRQTASAPAPQEDSPPMPYEYKYDVEDQEKALFFGANEAGDAQGKVNGGYRVLLPDGRLMTVEYTVEGDSGFVPKITFEDNANPFGKGK